MEEWVIKETTARLLASALERVTFEDSYQWEEVGAAEKRTRSGTSEKEVVRKRLRPRPVMKPLKHGTTGQALLEADITVGTPFPANSTPTNICEEIPVLCISKKTES